MSALRGVITYLDDHPLGDKEVGGRVSCLDGNAWDTNRDGSRGTKCDKNGPKNSNNNNSKTPFRRNGSVRRIFSHANSHTRTHDTDTEHDFPTGGEHNGFPQPPMLPCDD